MDYAARLAEIRQQWPQPLTPGSSEEAAALDRFRAFFADFTPAKVALLLPQTYAEDVWFNDTLKTVRGRERLGHYLAESAAAVEACRVQIDDLTHNGQGDYYVRWRMMIRFRRFKRGTDTHSIGISHLRFDERGQVLLHQDYWDATQGLFEHVPVLGSMIRWIKRRV
ncbi:MAG: nuclear transport factor 2 family protein [Lysobacterales bacterium]